MNTLFFGVHRTCSAAGGYYAEGYSQSGIGSRPGGRLQQRSSLRRLRETNRRPFLSVCSGYVLAHRLFTVRRMQVATGHRAHVLFQAR